MKRMQDMEIKGMHFCMEEVPARDSANMINAYNHSYKYHDIYYDIYDAYKNPSAAKVSVWNEWVQWAEDVNTLAYPYEVKNLRICAHNCQMFTVSTIIRELAKDDSGNYLTIATYIMVATKYHNYLYLLTSDESGEDIDICW